MRMESGCFKKKRRKRKERAANWDDVSVGSGAAKILEGGSGKRRVSEKTRQKRNQSI